MNDYIDNLILRFGVLGTALLTTIVVLMAIIEVYGICQLYDREARLDLREAQRAKIARLETKVMFLENNDWALIVQNIAALLKDELPGLNEEIKQRKQREAE